MNKELEIFKMATQESGTYYLAKEKYGLYIKLSGRICNKQIKQWMTELKTKMDYMPSEFSAVLDLTEVSPICTDTARVLAYIRAYLHGKGLNRLSIVYTSSASILSLMSSFSDFGTNHNERHISAMVNSSWKESAEKWATKGIEP